jgi:hypothetical protein
MLGNLLYVLVLAGRWDEADRVAADVFEPIAGQSGPDVSIIHFRQAYLLALRGDVPGARRHFAHCEHWRDSDDAQAIAMYWTGAGALALAAGEHSAALEVATRAVDELIASGFPLAHEVVRTSLPDAIDAAVVLGDIDSAERLVGLFADHPPGEVPPFLRAQVIRARALIAASKADNDGVEERLASAEATFSDLGYPYWTARAKLDRAEWLHSQQRSGEAVVLATDAGATFEMLGAEPMRTRARRLLEQAASAGLDPAASATRTS